MTYYRKNYVAVQYTDPNDTTLLGEFGCQLFNNADNQLAVLVGGDTLVVIPLNGWAVKSPGDPPERIQVRSDEDFRQQYSPIDEGSVASAPAAPPAGATPPSGDAPSDPTEADTEPPVAPTAPDEPASGTP